MGKCPDSLKKSAQQVAFKIVGTLLGGPVSEALHLSGVDFEGELSIEVSGPDLLSVQSIHMCLSNNFPNHEPDYINSSLTQVVNLLKQPQSWSAIEHLSSTLLSSANLQLNREQIEESLSKSGYLIFIQ